MTTTSDELLQAIEALSPEAREEIAALGAKRTETMGKPLDLEERRRILCETRGSITMEEARELIRLGREAFDVIDDAEAAPSRVPAGRRYISDPDERRRLKQALWGCITPEEAAELIRVGREAFDVVDEDEWKSP